MSVLPLKLGFVCLFAAENSVARRALEFDLPEEPWEWAVYGGGFALIFLLAISVYVRDTLSLSGFWKVWLTTLRVVALAALVVIAVNPQERTERMSQRPSRVVVVVDTSLSMRYPETIATPGTQPGGTSENRSRADAVKALLAAPGGGSASPLIEKLREQHEVSVYTFDSSLSRPHSVFHAKTNRPAAQPSGDAANRSPGFEKSRGSDTPADKPLDRHRRLDWDEILRPRGLETRMGESLLDLLRQQSGSTLSGIVVWSDGGANAGIEPATANDVAKESTPRVRLITVGVGSTQAPVNLQVANIQAPTDVHLGDGYEISAFIQGQGLTGRAVEVELLMRPEGANGGRSDDNVEPIVVDSREVTLHEAGIPVELKFQRTPSVAGSFEFFVRAKPTSKVRELSDEDNERRKTIRIVDRKTRVLLMAGGPMRDYRFVRNMLYRHKAVKLDVWLQTVDPSTIGKVSQESDNLLIQFPQTAAELVEYDVIIAFDPDWTKIPADHVKLLVDWVSQHAGGLILVAGDVYTPDLASTSSEVLEPLKELYPVFLNPYLLSYQFDHRSDQAWPIGFTREGRDAGFLQMTDNPAGSADAWKEFDGVYRCYPTGGAKAGAAVYAHFSDPRSQTEHGQPILLASQFYGAGRTLYLGSAEMWRLRALSSEYYDRLWTKVIREVGQGRLKRGTSRGMLLLERNQYVLGQTVRVRAHLYNPQMEQLDVEKVVVEVYDPNGKPLIPAREMHRDRNRPGQYVGDFRASLPGTYRLELAIPESQELLVDKIDVVLPNLESDNPQQNAKLLTDLARDTGGKYLRLEEAEAELPALLPNRSEEFLVDERLRTLWDRDWVLYLLVGLLSLEWLTRKLLKLA